MHFFDRSTAKSASELTCFVHFHFKMCVSPQRRAFFRQEHSKKCFGADVFCTFSLQNVRFATAACIFSTSELQKVLPDPQFFNIFTCKCAFRHSRVQFFNIRTYQSGPNTSCFVHFDLQMCFAPQPRAIFEHLKFQNQSEIVMFCAF